MKNEKQARVLCPRPENVQWQGGFLLVGASNVLHLPAALEKDSGEMFQDSWSRFTLGRGSLELRDDSKDYSIVLTVTGKLDIEVPVLDDGAEYSIEVNSSGLAVAAKDASSLKLAWMTVLQLIAVRSVKQSSEQFALPCVKIHDKPSLQFRGIHFCVFPETSLFFLERMMRLSAFLKYTHIVVEFWGMLKLDAMSELSWPQAYTKEQVKPVFDAVRAMGAEIVPMFNHWGHASAAREAVGRHVVLDQNPLLAELFEPDGWTWCFSNPETYALQAEIRRELMELAGPGNYFHLGCDEARSHGTCDMCATQDSPRLLGDYLNRLDEDIAKTGRRPMVWGDAFLSKKDWDKPVIATCCEVQRTYETLDMLSRNIIIADWQYSIQEGDVPTLAHFMDRGFDVVLSPWYDKTNIDTLAEAVIKNKAFGLLETTWHTLPQKIDMVNQAAEAAWGNNDEAGLYPLMSKTTLAAFLRKLVPTKGNYTNAGWRCEEVEV